MKLNSLEFKEYLINEIKILAENQGWSQDLSNISENTFNHFKESEFELIDPDDWKNIVKEDVDKIDIQKLNNLNEELKRMRELVDFRNPFFSN